MCTAALSEASTTLPESSSRPLPAKMAHSRNLAHASLETAVFVPAVPLEPHVPPEGAVEVVGRRDRMVVESRVVDHVNLRRRDRLMDKET